MTGITIIVGDPGGFQPEPVYAEVLASRQDSRLNEGYINGQEPLIYETGLAVAGAAHELTEADVSRGLMG